MKSAHTGHQRSYERRARRVDAERVPRRIDALAHAAAAQQVAGFGKRRQQGKTVVDLLDHLREFSGVQASVISAAARARAAR